MASYSFKSDTYISCPFNKAHRILKSRFQKHLVKCKKDHLDVVKTTCPFNAQHLLDPSEVNAHVAKCPDKCIVDRQIMRKQEEKTEFRGASNLRNSCNDNRKLSEVWDISEEPRPGYDPKKNLSAKSNLIRDLAHWKPSEKKKYYAGKMDSTDNENEEVEDSLPKPPVVSRPLRQPKSDAEILQKIRFPNVSAAGPFKSKLAINFIPPSNQQVSKPSTSELVCQPSTSELVCQPSTSELVSKPVTFQYDQDQLLYLENFKRGRGRGGLKTFIN